MDNIFFQYFLWHFYDAPQGIFTAWRNFLWFNLNYFSIPTLLKTFFYHWHKYYYPYGKLFSLKRYFEAFVFNVMSRIIGMILRAFLIAIGILTEVFIIFLGAVMLFLWLVLPLMLIFGLIFAFKMLV